jgi:hypothetical protein
MKINEGFEIFSTVSVWSTTIYREGYTIVYFILDSDQIITLFMH